MLCSPLSMLSNAQAPRQMLDLASLEHRSARGSLSALPASAHAQGAGAPYLDAPVVDEAVVHLEVRLFAGLIRVETKEGIAQRVPRLPVLDDVAGRDVAKPGKDDLQVLQPCNCGVRCTAAAGCSLDSGKELREHRCYKTHQRCCHHGWKVAISMRKARHASSVVSMLMKSRSATASRCVAVECCSLHT